MAALGANVAWGGSAAASCPACPARGQAAATSTAARASTEKRGARENMVRCNSKGMKVAQAPITNQADYFACAQRGLSVRAITGAGPGPGRARVTDKRRLYTWRLLLLHLHLVLVPWDCLPHACCCVCLVCPAAAVAPAPGDGGAFGAACPGDGLRQARGGVAQGSGRPVFEFFAGWPPAGPGLYGGCA